MEDRKKIGVLCVVGIILVAIGASLIAVVETILVAGIREAIIIDTNEEFKDLFTDVSSDYYVHFWNCTNLKAALANTEVKPYFEEVIYKFTYLEDNYDLEWHNNREEFTYKSWWTYVPADDLVAEKVNTELIVQVNAVYMAAIADLGNSEQLVFAGLSSLAVQAADAVLDTYIQETQSNILIEYINAQDITSDLSLVGLAWTGMIDELPEDLAFLECSLNASDTEIISAWQASSPSYVLTAYDDLYADQVTAALKEGSSNEILISCLAEVAVSNNAASYFLNSTNTWEEVKAAQFGQGLASLRQTGESSVLAELIESTDGLVVAPELYGAYDAILSIEESLEFLRVFTDPSLNLEFATTLLASDNPLSVLDDPTYVDAGVKISNLLPLVTYLYTYLPETFFLAGYVVGYQRLDPSTTSTDPRGESSLSLLESGTGIFNSGLFTMRTPNEFLFGYHDRIFDLVPQDFATIEFVYSGTLGYQYSSVDDQRQVTNTPLVYGQRSGKNGLENIGEYILWRNATVLTTRETFEGKQPDSSFGCETWEAQGYESCNIWLGAFGASGYPYNRVDPFRQNKEKKVYKIWTTEIMRPTEIEYDQDTTVRGMKGYKYTVRDSFLRTSNCTIDPECNPENAFYRVNGPSFIFPMATSQGGTGISLSHPAFGRMDEVYRSQTNGLPEYQESKHGVYVVAEPYTGYFIKGHLRLQYNYDLDTQKLTSSLWTNLFDPNMEGNVLYWPYLWFDDSDTISKATARKFRRAIYLSQDFAIAFTVILIVLGLACLVAAFLIHRKSSRNSIAKGEEAIEFTVIEENGHKETKGTRVQTAAYEIEP